MWWRHLRAIVLLPGTATVVIPAMLVRWVPAPAASAFLIPAVQGVGAMCFLSGLTVWALTVRTLARQGRGTLAPWDPTRRLVVEGLYRHVRNPMITAVCAMLLGEALWLGSWTVIGWLAVFAGANAVYIPQREEKGLERRFGDAYRAYRRAVPRWVPRWKGWNPDPGS